MSTNETDPTPGEVNNDKWTTEPTSDPEAVPAPVKIPPTAVDANGDAQPDLTEAEKEETEGDGS